MNRIFVWTDIDLDGAGCLLAFKWLFESKGIIVDHRSISNGEDHAIVFSAWFKNNASRYDKIFICDISLDEAAIACVDNSNVVVVDHHKTHEALKDKYTKATCLIYEYTSAVKIIYEKFKLKDKLTKQQQALIMLIDDYDCYNLKYSKSLELNIIIKSKKFDYFVDRFEDGLVNFNDQEQNIITLFYKELNTLLNDTDYFEGELNGLKIIAFYTKRYASEMCHIVLKRFNADACIAVNTQYGSVSFRKRRGCKLKLNNLAEKLCNGGGHEFAAAGKITDRFINFLKIFKQIDE